jgi:hypothetical protein
LVPVSTKTGHYTVYTGEWEVGRIYQTRSGPDSPRWFRSLTVNGPMTRGGGTQGNAGEHPAEEPPGVRLNEHTEHPDGLTVFQHACRMELEGIVSKRLGSRYRSGRSPDWLKFKNPEAPAVKREAEEDWGR